LNAMEKTGRSIPVMEIEPLDCDIIVRRWEESRGERRSLRHQPWLKKDVAMPSAAAAMQV